MSESNHCTDCAESIDYSEDSEWSTLAIRENVLKCRKIPTIPIMPHGGVGMVVGMFRVVRVSLMKRVALFCRTDCFEFYTLIGCSDCVIRDHGYEFDELADRKSLGG